MYAYFELLICRFYTNLYYMRRRIKGAARAINAIWRTTVLYFPIVGKYRTVAGFAPLFLSDTLSLNKRTILGPVVARECRSLGLGQGVEMMAVYNS